MQNLYNKTRSHEYSLVIIAGLVAHIDTTSSHEKEFSLVELEEQRETLLQKFSHTSTLYVVPRVAYDVLINTQELSSETAAQKIIEF